VIADDNAACLEQFCKIVADHFDVVGRAANGVECVEAVSRLLPSVALTDISMPGLNGIEATKQITSMCPHVKVVVISDYDDPAFVEAAFAAGASAYVMKIRATEDLVPTLHKVMGAANYERRGNSKLRSVKPA
jgi:DNA-binding NarL/FixJ family response regulator